jgi:hypothetical protein
MVPHGAAEGDLTRGADEQVRRCSNCAATFPLAMFAGIEPNCCPACGNLLPDAANHIENYFRIIQLVDPLHTAAGLILKSECVAAVRDALVTFEHIVRSESGLSDLTGSDLMAKALSFRYDAATDTLTEAPRIQISDLSTVTGRNEQNGIRFLAMGLMQGIRNVYMHAQGSEALYYCIQVITTADLLLKQILRRRSLASS